MRVLMLTPCLPQPTGSGAAIRNWHILHGLLAAPGLRVEVLTFGTPEALPPSEPLPEGVVVTTLPAPRRGLRRRLALLAGTRRPDLADRLWSPEAQARLIWGLLQGGVDLIHIGGLELGRYALELGRLPRARRPAIVLDEYNAEYLLQRRAAAVDAGQPQRWPQAAYSAIQSLRLRAFERAACRLADAVVSVSAEDAAALRALDPAIEPTIIPNGVDTERYAPAAPDAAGLPRYDLVFSGTLDYRPNVDAAVWLGRRVWPGLRSAHPSLTLGLVGQSPAGPVRALGSLPGIMVTGPVPDDRPYLWGAGLYVVPMRYGGGVRLKLLNALAAGCPVVTTAMGAEGIPVADERELLIADDVAGWVRAVTRLLDEPAFGRDLAAAGRRLVQERFEWRRLVAELPPLYEATLGRRATAPVVLTP